MFYKINKAILSKEVAAILSAFAAVDVIVLLPGIWAMLNAVSFAFLDDIIQIVYVVEKEVDRKWRGNVRGRESASEVKRGGESEK